VTFEVPKLEPVPPTPPAFLASTAKPLGENEIDVGGAEEGSVRKRGFLKVFQKDDSVEAEDELVEELVASITRLERYTGDDVWADEVKLDMMGGDVVVGGSVVAVVVLMG
jgi:hypothetical protein